MSNEKKTILILYEVKQIDRALQYLEREHIPLETCRVVALEYEVEYVLRERGIAHTSVLEYVPMYQDFDAEFNEVQRIARETLLHPALSFYESRGVRLGETHIAIFQFYLDKLFHSFFIAEKILAAHPGTTRVIVPRSTVAISPTFGPLVYHHVNSIAVAWHFFAQSKNIEVSEFGLKQRTLKEMTLKQRARRKVLTTVLRTHNFLVETFVPKKPLKIFVSDYWRHIQPFVTRMDDAEFVLMDRSEAAHIGLKKMWKHRMRFYHPDDFATEDAKREVKERMHEFRQGWESAKKDPALQELCAYKGVSFWPEVEDIFSYLIGRYARRMVADTIYFKNLYKELGIQKVLLRASRSGQYHFYIAAKTAAQAGIPSIELQHAAAVIDPRQVFSLLDTSYLAGYGPQMQEEYVKNHGYAPEQIRSVGSPRFDRYLAQGLPDEETRAKELRAIGLDPTRPTVFVSVPYEYSGLCAEFISSYEIADFFSSFARVKKEIPGIQLIFKFRPGSFSPFYQKILREALQSEEGVHITNNPNVFSLMSISDIVCTNYSTIMYETMICKKALVLYPWKPENYALRVYSKPGLYIENSDRLVSELAKLSAKGDYWRAQVQKGTEFLEKGYSFDGRAAERIDALLHEELKVF